jgi:anti-sigma-K factor RskA
MTYDHETISSLLGVAAIDALEPQEMDAVTEHVSNCSKCRMELDELRESATLLGSVPSLPPDHIWANIQSTLETAPPPMRLVKAERPRWKRASVWFGSVAASVALVAAGSFAIASQIEGSSSVADMAADAMHNPEARVMTLESSDGQPMAKAVILPDGTSFLMDDQLPALDDSQTYQLWAKTGEDLVSAGVLGTDPQNVPFTVSADIEALAITKEVRGGVVQSSNDPVAIVTTPS